MLAVNDKCNVCCVVLEPQRESALSRRISLELYAGFHLSDAMYFCRRGMEVFVSSR